MTTTIWALIALIGVLAGFNVGRFLGERGKDIQQAALQAVYEDSLKRERGRTAVFLKMTQDLQRQLVRTQRATVGLPEVGPREPRALIA